LRCSWILFLLLLGNAFAQVAAPPRTPQQKTSVADEDDDDDAPTPSRAVSTLPAQTPVITIKGICDRQPSKPASKAGSGARTVPCATVVTRAEFERLTDALQPGMPTSKKQQLGAAYSKFIVTAHEAKKRGLDKSADVELMMEFARLQILTEKLNRTLQNEAARISDEDISDYYRKSIATYEQATLQRIFIPRTRRLEQAASDGKPESKKAEPMAGDLMKQEADSIYARAVAGEAFEQLQKEAFATAGVKGTSSTNMGVVRRSSLPPAHVAVFELKPGEVSQVISDSTGHYVYRMVSKGVLPLEQVKNEISSTVQGQRMSELAHGIQGSSTIELNDAYFAPPPVDPAPVAATSKTETNITRR
jgi:hypothetical protein